MERFEQKPPCGLCRKLRALYGKEPNCQECLPDVWPENQNAMQVFGLVKDQHIMGFKGPIELNLCPVFDVMRMLKIKDKMDCLEKVKAAYNHRIILLRETMRHDS